MFSWECPESHNPHIATLQWYYLYAGCTMIMFGQSHTLSWWRHTRLSLALLVPPWNILKAGRSIHKRSCSIFLLGPTWTNMDQQGTSVSSTAFTSPLRWVSFNSCKSRGPQWSNKSNKCGLEWSKISRYKRQKVAYSSLSSTPRNGYREIVCYCVSLFI